jgi:hypothetical protein
MKFQNLSITIFLIIKSIRRSSLKELMKSFKSFPRIPGHYWFRRYQKDRNGELHRSEWTVVCVDLFEEGGKREGMISFIMAENVEYYSELQKLPLDMRPDWSSQIDPPKY